MVDATGVKSGTKTLDVFSMLFNQYFNELVN